MFIKYFMTLYYFGLLGNWIKKHVFPHKITELQRTGCNMTKGSYLLQPYNKIRSCVFQEGHKFIDKPVQVAVTAPWVVLYIHNGKILPWGQLCWQSVQGIALKVQLQKKHVVATLFIAYKLNYF